MKYKEYFQQEDGSMLPKEKFSKFNPGFIDSELYREIHSTMPIMCMMQF